MQEENAAKRGKKVPQKCGVRLTADIRQNRRSAVFCLLKADICEMEKLQIIINATDNCITENMNLHLFEIICLNRLVVLKIHDNVFWGLHYTIFCIRMGRGHRYGGCPLEIY